MISLKDEEIKKAYEVLEKLSQDPKTREIYEMREKWEHDEVSWLNEAKRDGFDEGMEMVTLKLLNENVDIETIVKVTGLSMEYIRQIKKE